MPPSSGTAVITRPTDTQILIVREFDAPRHLVFTAWTTPALIRRWWGAGHGEVTVADVDLRVGGTWRHVIVTPDGTEVAFHGEYREIVPDERIVQTEVYEAMPDSGVVDILEFTEADGRTTLTMTVECGSREIRDIMLDSGMESGMQAGFDVLEQIAIELSA